MTGAARESVEQRRNVASTAAIKSAQAQLKTWGFNSWAKFLTDGTNAQAAEVLHILAEPVTA